MHHKHVRNSVLIGFGIVVIINIIFAVALHYDYSRKVNALNDTFNTHATSVFSRLDEEQAYNIQQRALLESKTDQNFQSLEKFFTEKTDSLELDLQTQLDEVEEAVEEASDELETKISRLQVDSSDFTSIIEDAVKAVVSVKTNTGQGSGVIYDKRGYIITNAHVVSGARAISVVDHDSNAHPVRLVGFATNADLAVLKIESNDTFDFLRFEDDVAVGERVIAIGNPLGLAFSVTEGIISATDREIDNTQIGYIQTDVSINPGNSGGPIVNTNKRIVGINTFKISASDGLGFAIPADVAEEVAEEAIEIDEI